jgi:hypothetical protein
MFRRPKWFPFLLTSLFWILPTVSWLSSNHNILKDESSVFRCQEGVPILLDPADWATFNMWTAAWSTRSKGKVPHPYDTWRQRKINFSKCCDFIIMISWWWIMSKTKKLVILHHHQTHLELFMFIESQSNLETPYQNSQYSPILKLCFWLCHMWVESTDRGL